MQMKLYFLFFYYSARPVIHYQTPSTLHRLFVFVYFFFRIRQILRDDGRIVDVHMFYVPILHYSVSVEFGARFCNKAKVSRERQRACVFSLLLS